MSSIERLVGLVEPMDFAWGLYADPCVRTPEFRYEVRVHGDGPYRIRETGGSAWEAAAKAADRVEEAARV